MTKLLTTRAWSLSRARLLLPPFRILLFNNDNTQNMHVHRHLQLHMRNSGAGRAHGQRHAHTTRSHGTRNGAPARAKRPMDPPMML